MLHRVAERKQIRFSPNTKKGTTHGNISMGINRIGKYQILNVCLSNSKKLRAHIRGRSVVVNYFGMIMKWVILCAEGGRQFK